ncbi:MAG TPA: TadE/TadG family type IV pilus assembly protein [Gaiellaceae bacterium]|nr:TadE/TadG family type IV pilus assembly protein [Gaiellaceae bacterium]HUJ56661.1 TadE/TadG family type IV pilus assembly protein [Gaiellaceae bacterium]
MTSRRRTFRSFAADDGQAIVEFAIVLPALMALLLAILQCGVAFSHYVTVTDAARAGGRQAVLMRVGSVTTSDVTAAVDEAAPDLNASKLGVSVTDASDPTFQTSGSTVQVTVTYPYSIDVLGWVVSSGNLSSTIAERLE